jgi:hypothetical protein
MGGYAPYQLRLAVREESDGRSSIHARCMVVRAAAGGMALGAVTVDKLATASTGAQIATLLGVRLEAGGSHWDVTRFRELSEAAQVAHDAATRRMLEGVGAS